MTESCLSGCLSKLKERRHGNERGDAESAEFRRAEILFSTGPSASSASLRFALFVNQPEKQGPDDQYATADFWISPLGIIWSSGHLRKLGEKFGIAEKAIDEVENEVQAASHENSPAGKDAGIL